jgi:alkanesulfonate monooxygenase
VNRAAFDTVFDLYFPAGTPAAQDEHAASAHQRDDPVLAEFRDRLATALAAGDEAALRALAREGVGRFGAVSGRLPGTQSWSAYSAASRISAQTLLARLLDEALYGHERGGIAEKTARTRLSGRIDSFRAMLTSDVQRRLAEQGDRAKVTRSAVRPSIEHIDLLSATRSDLANIRREIQPLARRLAARLASRQRHGHQGPLDFRRTIRASLSSGGIPMQTHHRPRRPHRTDLVILCDVSESVTSFAHFTLLLVYALREQFSRVRVFAFIDNLDEVTELFRPGTDVVESVARLASGADVRGWSGRTDYGRAFGMFKELHLDAITARTSLLVLGDARSNYGDPALPALRAMAARARRAYWLNPERRSAWDTGDSVASEVGEIVSMVECRNLAQLSTFVRDLVCRRSRMELGLHVPNFTWPGGPPTMARDLRAVAIAAEDAGFSSLSVMDHVWQIHVVGPPELDMLEAYTTLGFLAAHTSRIDLLAWVTAVVYREPGLLAKAVTTLDVLSEGRAWLGIGAAWNEEESRGLGLPFPSTAERFERLEEALQICLQMWSDDESAYEGKHYTLGRTLNVPQSLQRPHPRILIGGAGEKKTLRMVAQYADACNLFGGPDNEIEHKLDVLRGHCADVGRDYDEILKTVMLPLDPGPNGEKVDELVQRIRELAALGIQHVHGAVPDVASITRLEILGERVIPEVASL